MRSMDPEPVGLLLPAPVDFGIGVAESAHEFADLLGQRVVVGQGSEVVMIQVVAPGGPISIASLSPALARRIGRRLIQAAAYSESPGGLDPLDVTTYGDYADDPVRRAAAPPPYRHTSEQADWLAHRILALLLVGLVVVMIITIYLAAQRTPAS